MPIWLHTSTSADEPFTRLASLTTGCLFCLTELQVVKSERSALDNPVGTNFEIRVCPTCGWWSAVRTIDDMLVEPGIHHSSAAAAVLRQFDTTGLSEPIGEIREYLLARYDARFQIHPRVFEETVASVFRSLGFQAVVTAYSGDNGIDIILTGDDDRQIGVQVKRVRRAVSVEAIRALTGALVVNDLTHGAFVTTSRFQKGARLTSSIAAARGVAIDLIDASRFFDALRIAQHHEPLTGDESFFPHWGQLINLGSVRYQPITAQLGSVDKQMSSDFEISLLPGPIALSPEHLRQLITAEAARNAPRRKRNRKK